MRRADKEVKNRDEIIDILNICKTAIIAMVDNNVPYVLPMSYGYEFIEDSLVLYFHCAMEGRKLDILKKTMRCALIFSVKENLCMPKYLVIPVITFQVLSETEKQKS